MHELNLSNLQRRLLLGGVAPKYVSRTIMELEAHFEELKQAACNAGVSEQEAIRGSNRKLGEEDVLVREALAKPELKSCPIDTRSPSMCSRHSLFTSAQ